LASSRTASPTARVFPLLVVALLAGCAAREPKVDPPDPLSGTRWALVALGGSPVLSNDQASMRFDKGRLAGSDGCNRYSTAYVATEKTLLVDKNIAATRMACAVPVMQEAAAFTSVLTRAAAYRREGERLTLLDGEGRPLASFSLTK